MRALLLLVLIVLLPSSAAAEPVDLELVLAVDASGSVSDEEFALQLGGIAAAFRDPVVQEAAVSGAEGRIAVSLLIWADARTRKAESAWMLIDGFEAAEAFAALTEAQLARRGAFLGTTGTGIGAALHHALGMIRRNEFDGTRRIVDISGDGRETPLAFGEAIALPEARREAQRLNVTVNGLAILTDDPSLDLYYESRVIAGPDSFVVEAADFHDFRRAIRLKLLREIRSLYSAAPSTETEVQRLSRR